MVFPKAGSYCHLPLNIEYYEMSSLPEAKTLTRVRFNSLPPPGVGVWYLVQGQLGLNSNLILLLSCVTLAKLLNLSEAVFSSGK